MLKSSLITRQLMWLHCSCILKFVIIMLFVFCLLFSLSHGVLCALSLRLTNIMHPLHQISPNVGNII